MFYYWRRIAGTLATARWHPPVSVHDELRLDYRVRTLDCDGLRVMTAAKYPVYMDLARWAIIARSPLRPLVLRAGLAPALGAQKVIYRHPLRRGSRFQVRVYAGGWDEKWIYHVHHFEQAGRLMALGLTRALLWKRGAVVPMRALLEQAGVSETEKPPPDWLVETFRADADDFAAVRASVEAP